MRVLLRIRAQVYLYEYVSARVWCFGISHIGQKQHATMTRAANTDELYLVTQEALLIVADDLNDPLRVQ